MKDAGIASIAWMVIMGDGMHNFSDGLAIGEQTHTRSVTCGELRTRTHAHTLCSQFVSIKCGVSTPMCFLIHHFTSMYIFMFISIHVEKYESHPQAVNISANRNSAHKMVLIVLSNNIM